jgi:hypothetical protein
MLSTSFSDYYQGVNLHNILCEGGLAGHMTHIYEDLNLTFGEFKNIFKDLISSNIEAVEKVDGQNIYFTWDLNTEQVKFARNKTEAEKGGITLQELQDKFKGRGPVENAFSEGGTAIRDALQQLGATELSEVFQIQSYNLTSGNIWINAEIMHSANPNVIQYSGNNVVLHDMDILSTTEPFTPETEMAIRRTKNEKFVKLVKLIETAEKKISSDVWRIAGPKVLKLATYNTSERSSAYDAFVQNINKVLAEMPYKEGNLSDTNTIGDYVEAATVKEYTAANYPQEASNIIGQLAAGKVARDKKKELVKRLKELNVDTKLVNDANLFKQRGQILLPLQKAVTDLSIEVLKGVSSYFVDVNQQNVEVQRIQKELQQVIRTVELTKDEHYEKRKQFLSRELERLKDVLNFASAIEGLVLEYPPGSGNKLKITGAFAPANQILGMAKYGRGVVPPLPRE